ncbi:uncharacterized protein redic1 isoform X2 [Gouania willdenowi]|uniref:uncharacterized protein redic1 isoform X2 n=1 Tax=Gouania willdenowi TaxID=441366 RepID=UPI00105438DF|nr:uncharacterized protein C12orf40 homolog isoform X2 [Gouania willdenowi]
MNWVGGSRNRLLMRSDAKKQKEFFEKKKMLQRLKSLGVAVPGSFAAETGSGSMDMVTLFIVNQIAAKKTQNDSPKIAIHGSSKGGLRPKRNEPLVLPMSPCSPSQLSLVESSYSSGSTRRKSVIPQGFKSHQLSPVLESTFSDNSASDYLPPNPEPHTPFSSPSSSSSGQELLPLKINLKTESQSRIQMLPHYSPPHWDTSAPQQTQFQLFSQPRDMTDPISWSCVDPPLFQLQTPTAAQVLFASPEPEITEATDCVRRAENFSEEKETMDFMNDPSESKEQVEDGVFKGFTNDQCEPEVSATYSLSQNAHMKIYLTGETPSSTCTESEQQCVDMEFPECTDKSFSCNDHSTESTEEYVTGYLSADSDDDEELCQICQENNPIQSQTKPRYEAELTHEDDFTEKTCQSQNQQIQSRSGEKMELCTWRELPTERKDAGTQTEHSRAAGARDASTQCSFGENSGSISTGFNHLPSTELSDQPVATRGQESAAREASALNPEREERSSKASNHLQKRNNDKHLTGGTIKHSETETLEEIADILLLMKQRKKK